MRQMIRDLLTYSRVGTEGKKLVPTDCNRVLEKVLANLHSSSTQNHANFISADLPTVMGNETQLLQLFQNLIGNALKFSRPTFSPTITISVKPEGEQWCFSIQDNGIGIKPENFNRIFGIFQRLETETEYPGTGIGLASCKKIVQRHGGRIWVESELGVGTVFYFTLGKV
ncbi:MAG: GHKL domain-containing protein, partial [Prochloron sp. SP5CPC1]|nr:GHKL domain-containing protein [Candidatus Paraprochloron terpiosi SP5CPC1]